jgi:hypothetical protein
MTYSEKLKDPRWQKRRLEVMDRDKFTCRKCNEATKTLNVHHRYYRKGAAPWEYPIEALITLCEPCHKEVEARIAFMNENIHRQESTQQIFFRLLCAELGEGPYQNGCFPWLIDSIADFLDIYENAVTYDNFIVNPEMMDYCRTELQRQTYDIMMGLTSAVLEAEKIMKQQLDNKQKNDVGQLPDNQCDDQEFWSRFMLEVQKLRPLMLHWVKAIGIINIDGELITFRLPESERPALIGMSSESSKNWLTDLASSLLGREVRIEFLIDESLPPVEF